jgi:hypothetical protein
MRKLIALVALLALTVPAAALADEGAPAGESAPAAQSQAKQCKEQRQVLGLASFKLLHGSNAGKTNALGKCVAKLAAVNQAVVANAAKTCKAEQDLSDDEFKAAHGGKAFAEHYGSGPNGKNAFGKCVSAAAKQTAEPPAGEESTPSESTPSE